MKIGTQLVTRRGVAAALLSLPAITLRPQTAVAGLFGPGGPQGEFRELQKASERMGELASKLKSGELRGERGEDAVVVLQTLAVQFGGTAKLMDKTTAAMPLLDEQERAKAVQFTSSLKEELENVKQGCRDRAAGAELGGVQAANQAIESYLAVAGSKYELPVDNTVYYSKDPKTFAAQYYGIFSCEGQGLERVKGSNTCKDTGGNLNPFPTKQFLDFDFLTGEKLDLPPKK